MRRTIIIKYWFVLIVGFNSMLFSQTPSENIGAMRFGQIKSSAKHAIRNGDTYSAIDYYEYMCQEKPKNNKYKYSLAELYREARDYEKAELWYKDAYQSDKKRYVLALYYQAQMQKSLGLYEESVKSFTVFVRSSKDLKEKRKYKKLSKVAIRGCNMALDTKDSLPPIMIQHLDTSINKAHIESSPFYVDENNVCFVSLRVDDVQYYDLRDINVVIPERNFHLMEKHAEAWKYKDKLKYPWDNESNISSGVYSKNGKQFYFSKCIKNWKNEMICSIYVSKNIEGDWSTPELLKGPVNDPKYTATQPALGVNSKNNQMVLYFVSDRPGGKGGYDIWYSSYNQKKGMFAKVKNAGRKVNTIGDEMTPSYNHQLHALFFSSTFWEGYGGFDVFKTYGELKKWEDAENLGKIINTGADDIHYTLAPSREMGLLVSNREGGISLKNKTCCDDLYEFKYTDFINLSVDGDVFGLKDSSFYKLLLKENLITQAAIDSSENPTRLDKYPVRLFLINKKTGTRILLATDSTNNGQFFFDLEHGKNYEIEVKNRETKIIRSVSTINISSSDQLHLEDIYVDIIPNEAIRLNNIYYEFDRSELTKIATNTLDTTILELMRDYPKIVVEILSHTDSKGEDKYNLSLSQARAESVVQYLISKGIDKNRLIAKGYGETKPIARNTLPNGKDNPTGRAKNRRTEFRIIGTIDKELFYDNESDD